MSLIVETALNKMPTLKKPQRLFILLLLSTLNVFQGKATFRNLSRYCSMSEKRISRWYRRAFDFATFNGHMLSYAFSPSHELIAALDASFLSKSGKKTDGLGMFWSGCLGKAVRGLEISLLSVINTQSNTAYALDAKQTFDQEGKTRVDFYAEHVISLIRHLIQLNIQYLVVDGYYFKQKFVSPVMEVGLQIVGKLRRDADLRWPHEGLYSGRGRPKIYDGKVDLDNDLKRFDFIGVLEDGEKIYTGRVYSNCLKLWVQVVMIRREKEGKIGVALLYSTDITLPAMEIVKYYKARFQIEFIFRDAKQYTGLQDCQARKKEAINTHINASFSALNVMKLEDLREKGTQEQTVISIASWKRLKFNQHLMCRVFKALGLSLNNEKVMETYKQLSRYGSIAA